MASAKHGTKPASWNKHFSKWMKRQFWKKARKDGKRALIARPNP